MDHLSIASIIIFLACGLLTGFLSGFFGIGGGIIMVPTLIYIFSLFKINPDIAAKQAVATSMAIITVSTVVSSRKHMQKKSFDKILFKKWVLPLSIGVIIGALLSKFLSSSLISLLFSIQIFFLMINMFAKYNYNLGSIHNAKYIANGIVPIAIGLLSSWLGVSGAVFMITVFTMFNVSMHTAIGTSATLSIIIATLTSITEILAGMGVDGRFAFSLGYINTIAMISMLPFVIATVPFGVKACHKFSDTQIRFLFAVLLLLIFIFMMTSFFIHH